MWGEGKHPIVLASGLRILETLHLRDCELRRCSPFVGRDAQSQQESGVSLPTGQLGSDYASAGQPLINYGSPEGRQARLLWSVSKWLSLLPPGRPRELYSAICCGNRVELREGHFTVQAHLGDTAGWVPDHHSTGSVAVAVMRVVIFLLVEGLASSVETPQHLERAVTRGAPASRECSCNPVLLQLWAASAGSLAEISFSSPAWFLRTSLLPRLSLVSPAPLFACLSLQSRGQQFALCPPFPFASRQRGYFFSVFSFCLLGWSGD